MKRKSTFFATVICASTLLWSASAEVGLQGILSSQGLAAMGQAVQNAAAGIFASGENVQSQLVELLNEAAATGNEDAVRYAITAVMNAGGADNLGVSEAAVNNSQAFSDFPGAAAETVAGVQGYFASNGTGGQPGGEGTGGGTPPSNPPINTPGSQNRPGGVFDNNPVFGDDGETPPTPK